MKNKLFLLCFIGFFHYSGMTQIHRAAPTEEKKLWKELKSSTGFKKIFKKYKKHRFEIIYTQINRDLEGGIQLTNFHLGDSVSYFYPASTVKLPLAIAIGEMFEKDPFYDMSLTMKLRLDTTSYCQYQFESGMYEYHRIQKGDDLVSICRKYRISLEDLKSWNHLTSDKFPEENTTLKVYHRKTKPTIADLISSMLIYSDNASYNKLFEIPGGGKLTDYLHEKGFVNSNVTRKFLHCIGEEKSVSVGFDLLNERDIIYYHGNEKTWKPAGSSTVQGIKVGKKHYFNEQLLNGPRDFSDHNRIPLFDLHEMMQMLLFPSCFPDDRQFQIKNRTRTFLIKRLGMYPSEHINPRDSIYDNKPDGMNIYIYNGNDSTAIPNNIRMINIVGQAYGFSTDVAYFTDSESMAEFMLSVRIYTNKNEILGDDTYEYDEIAMPLMKKLGEFFLEKEKKREKEVLPNFAILRSLFE